MVTTEVLSAITFAAPEHPNTLVGTSLRIFGQLRRALELYKTARERRSSDFNDEVLADLVNECRELEKELDVEKLRYAELVKSELQEQHQTLLSIPARLTISEQPEIYFSWQYMHEGLRVATLLVLNAFVLETPPQARQIRLLVRQALSLLETMYEQDLPGFCSAHFVLFAAALCAAPGQSHQDRIDDRERVERLYEHTL
jgi:hypothetical protein